MIVCIGVLYIGRIVVWMSSDWVNEWVIVVRSLFVVKRCVRLIWVVRLLLLSWN